MTGSSSPTGDVPAISIRGVTGIPEVRPGHDIAALILDAVSASGQTLSDGDIVVITSKIISKAENRVVIGSDREAAIDSETVRVVSQWRTPRGVTRIVENRQGLVMAAAGVDASNVEAGHVVLLPVDPDASARRIRRELRARTTVDLIGVIVTDTAGRAWRDGVVDLAIGAAGVRVVDDLRGRIDDYGNPLDVTVVALADEIASASELVRGKLAGVPVAIVRGLGHVVGDEDGPGARRLIRASAEDRFRLGTPDAMRAAVAEAREVRRFTGAPIDGEVLADALAAATAGCGSAAPVASWRLEAVTDPARIDTILAGFPEHGDVAGVAGVAAVIIPHPADSTSRTAVAVGSALRNVMIRLAADGIGSAYLAPADAGALGIVVAGVPG